MGYGASTICVGRRLGRSNSVNSTICSPGGRVRVSSGRRATWRGRRSCWCPLFCGLFQPALEHLSSRCDVSADLLALCVPLRTIDEHAVPRRRRGRPEGWLAHTRQDGAAMALVMVQTDKNHVILVDEKNVRPIHLGSESAGQLLERVGWTIGDAERQTARRTVRKYVAAVVPPSIVQQSNRTVGGSVRRPRGLPAPNEQHSRRLRADVVARPGTR